MGTDFVLTIISVEKFHISTKRWDERLNTQIKLDESRLNQRFDKLLESLSWNQKRFLTSFPQLKFTDIKAQILQECYKLKYIFNFTGTILQYWACII